MPNNYPNAPHPHDRYAYQFEGNSVHSYSHRHVPMRPDFARSQTVPRAPMPGPPHGPMFPDHEPAERSYPSHHAPHPTYTRHHHSYYDERGPLPPPPLHHRHAPTDDHYYAYERRSPTLSSAPHHHAPYAYGYPGHAHRPAHPSARPSLHPHHTSFSSAGSPTSSSLHGMRGSIVHSPNMPTGSHQQPTYRGHIKTTKDAILLLAACDLVADAGAPGIPPPRRVTRRLLDSERADLICSGSIFVWDEKEAGMRRWTDGKCWSASRVSGCFLTYRELEARKKPSSSITGGPTSNLYKAEGLIKQSFSMTTTSGRKLHVISYYTKRDVREGLLRRVSEDPRFVGENGGEWGLEVDEAEYPDPISRAGDLPAGLHPDELEGSQSPQGPAHAELADVRTTRGEATAHGKEVAYPERKRIPSPRSAVDTHVSSDRSRALPVSREARNALAQQHESAARQSVAGRDADSHANSYGRVKSEPNEKLSYPAEVTPLHEARGLLPIRPIPVDSKLALLPLRRDSHDSAPDAPPHHAHDAGHLYGRKRSYQDFRGASRYDETQAAEAGAGRPIRPRLQRMRSSSMSHSQGSAQDVLAPIRALGRVNSDDEGVSKLRSTHTGTPGFKEQHDSAVGALLSLRSGSGSSDDSCPSKLSPATTAPSSADADEANAKPAFSRMDRAALDRFSVRI